jgi:Uma2 family endonuclease
MAVVMPAHRPFTVDDLDHFPSDGNRYELIEGSLHVTPAPIRIHQRIVGNTMALLRAACPPRLEVLAAPFDVRLGPATQVQPDLIVLPVDAPAEKRLEGPPLLAVEVLSPSTRAYDLGSKHLVYREAGVGAYWVVDPEVPSVTAWRWVGDDEQVATAEGHEATTFDWPYPVTVTPARLLLANG